MSDDVLVNDAVQYELDGHVATITYNRPDALNAVNGAMRIGLNDAFTRFRDDENAWVAIVTGAGRAFCAGGDLRDGAGSIGEFPGTYGPQRLRWIIDVKAITFRENAVYQDVFVGHGSIRCRGFFVWTVTALN